MKRKTEKGGGGGLALSLSLSLSVSVSLYPSVCHSGMGTLKTPVQKAPRAFKGPQTRYNTNPYTDTVQYTTDTVAHSQVHSYTWTRYDTL